MNQGFNLYLLLLAAAALIIVFRLWGVLGRGGGVDDPVDAPMLTRDALNRRRPDDGGEDDVIDFPSGARRKTGDREKDPERERQRKTAAAILAADPHFDIDRFLTGARSAYERIIGDFVAGNAEDLRPLLNDDVFNRFKDEIDRRESEGEEFEWQLVALESCKIVEASMKTPHVASATVAFTAEIVSTTRDADGKIIGGSETRTTHTRDLWTFERDIQSNKPDWTLTATETA